MKSPYFNKNKLKQQKGQMFVFASFLMILLLIAGGLSVDVANVFLKKTKMQRALDASSVAGISQYESGISDSTTIQNNSVQIARYNLRQMGFKEEQILSVTAGLTVDANRVATLVLSAEVREPTMFMRLVPVEELDHVDLSGVATSRRIPAIISLVLDTSGSMDGGKLWDLKSAANAFVDLFQNDLDQMALIEFGSTASVLQSMTYVNKTHLHTLINGLNAEGWTNIAEAVTRGRIEIENAVYPTSEVEPVKAILLFTDGAPNVFRGIFTQPKDPPVDRNYPWSSPQYADYHLYAGNSPILVVDPYSLNTECYANYTTDVRRCFYSLAYLDSRQVYRPGSSSISRTSRTEMLRETYDLAIVETDYAKTDHTIVYTIGLGTTAYEGSDPYQSVTEYQRIKSYLLRRIANDPETRYDPDFPGLDNNSNHPVGSCFLTPDSDDLVDLFEAVARKIKIRLIQ